MAQNFPSDTGFPNDHHPNVIPWSNQRINIFIQVNQTTKVTFQSINDEESTLFYSFDDSNMNIDNEDMNEDEMNLDLIEDEPNEDFFISDDIDFNN
ncbi:hypothetical protein M0811_12569 [Anaeramoeba ignava]|uniref:Uncharacterized protein n=1 Tax=Anaeramoeba ignava TaxID=1746090 RepID=A0A9Q0R5L4_ANAIG|nr:hypothetical protein M0811_12569 [Anaeramoeba ignava]